MGQREEITRWTELVQALTRGETGVYRRLAAEAREATGAGFVAIGRASEPPGRGVSFVAVDGPAGSVACLAEEGFASLWRQALEARRAISKHFQPARATAEDLTALRRLGIEGVVVIPLEAAEGNSVGVLLAGFPAPADLERGRAALDLYSTLTALALVEEGRGHRGRIQEHWLGALVDSLESGVLLVEARGGVRLASPRLAPLFGLDPVRLAALATFDQLLAAVRPNFRDARGAEARWREIRRRGDEAAWDEIEFARPAPHVVERFARPVEDPDGARLGWIEIYRDVTAERQKRARLPQLEKMAALGQLVSGIAHELNNPLTSILGYAQILLASPPQAAAAGPPRREGGEARHILSEAQRAGSIVRNLLLYARDEAPERKPVRLNEVIERMLALRQYELRLENIQVDLELERALPWLHADPQALQQLVLNLLMNAEQAVAQSGGGQGRIEIRTRSAPDSRVRLEVRDDGPGIPPEIQARIFDPFFTTKPAGVGTGLGLYIVHSIAQDHGGEVRVESEAGRGATFVVELPAASRPTGPEPAEPPLRLMERPSPAAPRAARHILVVEDEPTVAQLVADVLRDEGHTVVAILDSFEALERLSREDFDLLICDLKMPRLDGRSLYEDAQRRGRAGPDRVLFITGDTLRPRTMEFIEHSGLPFLAKPFLVEELLGAVHAVLDCQDSAAPADEPPQSRSSLARDGGY